MPNGNINETIPVDIDQFKSLQLQIDHITVELAHLTRIINDILRREQLRNLTTPEKGRVQFYDRSMDMR